VAGLGALTASWAGTRSSSGEDAGVNRLAGAPAVADTPALQHHVLAAVALQHGAHRQPGLAGADDDRVVMFWHPRLRRRWIPTSLRRMHPASWQLARAFCRSDMVGRADHPFSRAALRRMP